jgi:hypothetical protein
VEFVERVAMDNKKKQGTFCATLLVVFLSVFPFLPFVVVDDVFLSLSLIIAIVGNVYDYASVTFRLAQVPNAVGVDSVVGDHHLMTEIEDLVREKMVRLSSRFPSRILFYFRFTYFIGFFTFFFFFCYEIVA